MPIGLTVQLLPELRQIRLRIANDRFCTPRAAEASDRTSACNPIRYIRWYIRRM